MSHVLPVRALCLAGAGVCWLLLNQTQIALAQAANQPSVHAVQVRHSQLAGWHLAETTNFRIFHINQTPIASKLAQLCEDSRTTIQNRWLGDFRQHCWTLKCDVYLYGSGQQFEKCTRHPAESWGFTDLEIGDGKVWKRRLNLRSDLEGRLTAVAIHELTHVVLADRFAHRQIPRWADEGIALNSEPPKRQQDMRGWLAAEIRQGRGYSLTQLMAMQNYPQDKHLGDLFYAQSGSLIEFLLTQNTDSEEGVMRLVESAQLHGAGHSLQGIPVARLEKEWKAWLLQPQSISVSAPQLADDRK